MYTYKLGGMLITDELYHDDLEAVTFGRKDQNELMHYGIKGQSWGKRRFQNEDGSLTAAGRNRYDVGAPLTGTTAANMSKNLTYKTWNGSSNGYGGAGGGGGSIRPNGSTTTRTYGGGTNGSSSYSFEYNKGPGQSAGRSVDNKVKAKVNGMVDSGRKAADSLFSSVGNALKPATDAIGKAAEFVTGANANRRVEDAKKAYDEASRDMMVDNRSYVIGTKGTNAEHDAENWQQLADQERVMAKAYDTSANNRGLFDFDGKRADRYQQDQHEAQAREYANKAHELRTQVPKEYEADYRRLEEADRNLRAAEKARDENTLGGVVGNAAKDAGNWLGSTYNDAKNWAGNSARDVGDWVGDRAQDVGNFATNAANAAGNAIGNAARDVGDWVGDRAQDVGNAVNGAAKDVANWGAGAVENGKNFFNNLFGGGNKEPEQPTLSDPNERIITENIVPEQIITEQRIPEQRITEQRIPEQRITEQRIPEQRITDSNSSMSDKPSNVSDEFWREYTFNGGTREQYDAEMQRMRNQNANRQQSSNDMSDKPSNVSDEFWREYTFNGGTRESYDREMNARKNSQNNGSSNTNSSISDKPDGVSDEYWREYTSNGGSRESYDKSAKAAPNYHKNENGGSGLLDDKPAYVSDEYWEQYKANGGTRGAFDAREEQWYRDHPAASLFEKIDYDAAEKQMNDTLARQNGNFASTSVVSGSNTVDTSRPHHFTYDPASGQTIVVYDDEKRR